MSGRWSKVARGLRFLSGTITNLDTQRNVSGYIRWITLRTNWFSSFLIRILVILVALSIRVRNYSEAGKMKLVFALISSWSWNTIVLLFLSLIISTAKNRFGQSSFEFTADLVVTDTLTKNLTLLVQLLLITAGRFRHTECVCGLSVLYDIFVLIWSRCVLGQVRPVTLGLTESGGLQLFTWVYRGR